MKQILLAFVLLLSLSASAQWPWNRIDLKRVEGNGNVKKETRDVSAYTGISSSGAWDVMVAYGESNNIQVEGDENLLEYIETKVDKGILSISSKNFNLHSKNKITIYVTVTRLTYVSQSGSGDIIGNGKFGNDAATEFKCSGSGGIKMGFGTINSLYVRVSGSGNIRLTGTSNAIETRVSGSGNIDCREVISDDATIHISGSGNARVFANKSVDARISGSGGATYYGAAKNVSTHVSGSGRVHKG